MIMIDVGKLHKCNGRNKKWSKFYFWNKIALCKKLLLQWTADVEFKIADFIYLFFFRIIWIIELKSSESLVGNQTVLHLLWQNSNDNY